MRDLVRTLCATRNRNGKIWTLSCFKSVHGVVYIYIYIYIQREREFQLRFSNSFVKFGKAAAAANAASVDLVRNPASGTRCVDLVRDQASGTRCVDLVPRPAAGTRSGTRRTKKQTAICVHMYMCRCVCVCLSACLCVPGCAINHVGRRCDS